MKRKRGASQPMYTGCMYTSIRGIIMQNLQIRCTLELFFMDSFLMNKWTSGYISNILHCIHNLLYSFPRFDYNIFLSIIHTYTHTHTHTSARQSLRSRDQNFEWNKVVWIRNSYTGKHLYCVWLIQEIGSDLLQQTKIFEQSLQLTYIKKI